MAYPEDMVYVRFEFGWKPTGATGDIEIQDFGMWGTLDVLTGISFDWQTVVDAIAKQATVAWQSNMPVAAFSGAVAARRVVAYHYDQAHLNVLDRGEAAFEDATAWFGSGDVVPPQLSTVVSTFGFDPSRFASQSRNKRGRYYLPTPSKGWVGGDGELTAANQSTLLDAVVSFQNALTGALHSTDPDVPVNVYWRPAVSSTVKKYATKISHVRVGRRFDIQRRRANALPENYVTDSVNT